LTADRPARHQKLRGPTGDIRGERARRHGRSRQSARIGKLGRREIGADLAAREHGQGEAATGTRQAVRHRAHAYPRHGPLRLCAQSGAMNTPELPAIGLARRTESLQINRS
jgi:hypothetical protein